MAVADFLKKHFVVVTGVALPLLLVLFLVIARGISQSQVADPRYDLLFTEEGTGVPRVQFIVNDGQLELRYHPPPEDWPHRFRYRTSGQLYYLDADRRSVHAISFQLPRDEDGRPADAPQSIDLPELAGIRLDPSPVAPDGYRLSRQWRSGGLLTAIWGGSSRSQTVLEKDGRRIRVTDPIVRGHRLEPIGWVIEGELENPHAEVRDGGDA